MLLFVCAALLTLGVCAVLVRPLLKEAPPLASSETFNAEIYRDQLAELDARGAEELDLADAPAARAEVQRRLLANASPDGAPHPPNPVHRPPQRGALALAAIVPLATGVLYLELGAPSQAFGQGPQSAPAEIVGSDPMHAEMDQMVAALNARLAASPDDPQGWALLARTQIRLGRNTEAVAAYERAHQLVAGSDRQLAAEYAEARVIAAEGRVDAVAKGIFERLLETSPTDPQARYYLALARGQAGDVDGALRDWRGLLADTPPDAPWRATLERQIASAEAARGPGSAPRGPTAEQVAAAEALAPDQRAAMINQMVEGLENRLEREPNDLEGWRRLARAYEVLGRTQDAQRAQSRILALSSSPGAQTPAGGAQ